MKSLVTVLLLLILAALPLAAEELVIEYLEGILEVKSGSRWEELDIGDTVSENTVIRLSRKGFAELTSGNVTVTLTKEGTYNTADLLQSSRAVSAFNVKKVVSSKLKKLMSPDQGKEAATMGVRGASQDDEELTWIEEGAEYLAQGRELLLQEEYEAAIEVFLEGADFAFSEDEAWEYLYYAAYAYAQTGNIVDALRLLADMDPDSAVPIFTDYVLLKGQLYIESLSFEEALELFDRYLENPDRGETTQLVHFLSAVCLQGLDRKPDALKSLEAAYAIDRSSEYGRAAKEMLDKLK
jgi:tetratricopeptide (TPR) repeat protein